MKKFLKNIIGMGICLGLLITFLEFAVPQKWITYRTWESLRVKNSDWFIGNFYPNIHQVKSEVGELAHHSSYAVLKPELTWKTDKFGFRNDSTIIDPDIILIGSSNIAGSALDQSQTLAAKLAQRTGLKVYNMAPSDFNDFLLLLESGLIQKPKILIHGNIERGIPKFKPPDTEKNKMKSIALSMAKHDTYSWILSYVDRLSKQNTLNFIKARAYRKSGSGIPSSIEKGMLFLQGQKSQVDTSNVEQQSDVIEAYEEYCNKIGIRYIFFPIPNKETLYYDWVPFPDQPLYLSRLDAELNGKGVETLDILSIFNSLRDSVLLYHYDDTHWNEHGVEVTVRELVKIIR